MPENIPSQTDFENYLVYPENLAKLESLTIKLSNKYLEIKAQEGSLDPGHNIIDSGEVMNTFYEAQRLVLEILNLDSKSIPRLKISNFDRKLFLQSSTRRATFLTLGGTIIGTIEGAPLTGLAISVGVSVMAVLAGLQEDWLDGDMYDAGERRIHIVTPDFYKAITIMAHEYTHHIQRANPILGKVMTQKTTYKNPVIEGHARLVESLVAQSIADKAPNAITQLDTLSRLTLELKAAYLFACRKRKEAPNPEVAHSHIKKLTPLQRSASHHYNIGSGVLQVAAAKESPREIARKVLAGDFKFMTP